MRNKYAGTLAANGYTDWTAPWRALWFYLRSDLATWALKWVIRIYPKRDATFLLIAEAIVTRRPFEAPTNAEMQPYRRVDKAAQ